MLRKCERCSGLFRSENGENSCLACIRENPLSFNDQLILEALLNPASHVVVTFGGPSVQQVIFMAYEYEESNTLLAKEVVNGIIFAASPDV